MPVVMDFSPIGDLAKTFFDARDAALDRKLKRAQLEAPGEWAKIVAEGQGSPSLAPSSPDMTPVSSLGQPSPGKLPTFAGGGSSRPMTVPPNPELAQAIATHAKAAGIDPVDLATAMSYETAGTFDPWKAGPTTQWGQHRGLIQWGEPQAKQYGVTADMPVGDQVAAAVKYLQDRGVKPGMGLMDIYSAINAGSVGRYNASDANNGGAPGTVADKVNNQMAGHRQKAMALLASFGGQPAPTADADRPAPGAQNAQYVIPGQQAPAQAATPSMPQIQIPQQLQAALQHPNPYVRQMAAKRIEAYQDAQRQWQMKVMEHNLDQGNKDRTYGLDREKFDFERNKPMAVGPEQDLVTADGVTVRQGRVKPETLSPGQVMVTRDGQEVYRAPANPVTVAPGASLVDPAGKPLYTAPNKDETTKTATELRKEILGLPSYKSYTGASPAFKSMVDAAQRDDKASDLNMVYALAKIMDPTSVVREGEIQMANDTQGYADKLNGFINSIQSGSRLSPEARLGLLTEAQSRMQAFKDAYDQDRGFYRGIVGRGGLNEADVIPDFGDLPDIDRSRINSQKRGDASQTTTTTQPIPEGYSAGRVLDDAKKAYKKASEQPDPQIREFQQNAIRNRLKSYKIDPKRLDE